MKFSDIFRQFVLVEGQGVDQVRACTERLREGLISGGDIVAVNRLGQVALMIAERYLPLAQSRGPMATTLEFQILGEELEALGRSYPEGSISRLYALHNSATCFAQVNGSKPDEQLRLNREVVAELQGRGIEIFDDTAEGLLYRKVIAGIHEAGRAVKQSYPQTVLSMIGHNDPDTLGRLEFMIKGYYAEARREAAREATREAVKLLGTPEHFKPVQVERLRTYLDSLK